MNSEPKAVHGKPNIERFARLMCELLAEQEGLCVTAFEYVPVEKKNRSDGASIEAVR